MKDVRKPPKDFRQSYFPGKGLKKLLDLPIQKRKAPLVLNFIPIYRSTLPDVPKRKKKKSSSSLTVVTQTASTSRADQGSTSDPAGQPSTSAPYLVPISERKRRRRLVKTVEMVRPKPVVQNLLADLPTDVDAVPTQTVPPPKPKKTKKAQPKSKATDAEVEDALPISQLAENKKTSFAPAKRPAEAQPSGSTQSKRPRSSSAMTSGSRVPKVPWEPKITLENRPVYAHESTDNVNIGVALSTAVLLEGDLERNAKMSEYENYAFMLQRSVQAIQHAHSLSMQAFENKEKLAEMEKECAALQKQNKSLKNKMKTLEDQAEAATQAQQEADEKAEAAEAIKTVAEAEKKEAQAKAAQAEKELHKALATKDAEIKAADDKANAQGMADVAEDYKLQVKQACNRGFSLGWMSLAKKLDLPADSPWHKAEAIPLPFPPPPPPPSQTEEAESESQAEDGDEDDDEALVRKSKDATETKSLPSTEQVINLTQDEEGDEVEEVSKETHPVQLSSDLLLAEKSVEKTLAEIDVEIAADKEAEVVGGKDAEDEAGKDTEVVRPEPSEVSAQPPVEEV